jgi:hypothetical protein
VNIWHRSPGKDERRNGKNGRAHYHQGQTILWSIASVFDVLLAVVGLLDKPYVQHGQDDSHDEREKGKTHLPCIEAVAFTKDDRKGKEEEVEQTDKAMLAVEGIL